MTDFYQSLVDDIANGLVVNPAHAATPSAILGPFYRDDTPVTPNDTSIVRTKPKDGTLVFMHGTVTDAASGKPLPGARIDVWQCSTNGLYEQ